MEASKRKRPGNVSRKAFINARKQLTREDYKPSQGEILAQAKKVRGAHAAVEEFRRALGK